MDFYHRSGLSTLPQLLLNGVPLNQQEVEGELEDAIYQRVLRQTSDLQRFVYNGVLTDKDKVIDFLMTQKNIMPRLNQRVLQVSNRYLNLAQTHCEFVFMCVCLYLYFIFLFSGLEYAGLLVGT